MEHGRQSGILESKYRYTWSLVVLGLDVVSLLMAFFLANFIRFGSPFNIGINTAYFANYVLMMLIIYLLIFMFTNNPRDFYTRGYLKEFFSAFKQTSYLLLTILLILFVFQLTNVYSRLVIAYTWVLGVFFIWLARIVYKKFLKVHFKNSKNTRYLVIITVWDQARESIERLNTQGEVWGYELRGVAIVDGLQKGIKNLREIDKVPIISSSDTPWNELAQIAVDEVLIDLPHTHAKNVNEMIGYFEGMGLVVNLNIQDYVKVLEERQGELRHFCGFNIISFAENPYNFQKAVIKRFTDIVSAIIGLVLTGVIIILLTPILKIESPGPVLFSQVRVGKNGRRFKLYKIRSMYADAEERKAQLMEKNEMNDDLMFKMERDPRITKLGRFIRRTSIDELPQFWNVLKGEMSLIGTRPPTLDEFKKYELQYKRRLSIKPGLTGLWQVSGRSEITNFKDVLKLDLEYIDNWSPSLDISIMLKSVAVVLFGKGAK